LSRSFLLL